MRYVAILLFLFINCLFSGCGSAKQAAEKKTAATMETIKVPDSLLQKQLKGIDLFAQGNVPVRWTLEMDFDNGYRFKTEDGINVITPAYTPTQVSDSLRRYDAGTSKGDISILLYESFCDARHKKTEVLLNSTRYTGCGNYLYSPAVNGKWILEKAGNIVLRANDFKKGLPVLEFDLLKNKMTGNNGCSNIAASIEMQGSRIKFSTISGNEAGCTTDMVQKIFAEKISNKISSYYFKDDKLYLYLIDDSLLIFKRA